MDNYIEMKGLEENGKNENSGVYMESIINEMIEKKIKGLDERIMKCLDKLEYVESILNCHDDKLVAKGKGIIYGSKYKMLVKEDIEGKPYIQILDITNGKKYGSKLKKVKVLNN